MQILNNFIGRSPECLTIARWLAVLLYRNNTQGFAVKENYYEHSNADPVFRTAPQAGTFEVFNSKPEFNKISFVY